MTPLSAALLFSLRAAAAEPLAPLPLDPSPDALPTEPAGQAAPLRLEEAKRMYFGGGHAEALAILRALSAEIDQVGAAETAIEILTYQGEIEYVTGDRAASWETFRALVERWPDHEIGDLHHPPEVVEWFGLVRREVRTMPEAPTTTTRQALPWWGWAPLGAPQLAQGRTGRGLLLGGLQAGFGAISVGVGGWLLVVNGPNHPDRWAPGEVSAKVNTWRWGVQIPATAAFWTLYAISVVDGRSAWRAQLGPVSVRARALPGGLVVSGRF
jgi:hypothetical protein